MKEIKISQNLSLVRGLTSRGRKRDDKSEEGTCECPVIVGMGHTWEGAGDSQTGRVSLEAKLRARNLHFTW